MLSLHDTASGSVRPFVPKSDRRVTMYACGPTVYGPAHIGNARPPVIVDVLFRLLRREYGADNVVYASNYTDIDDKIMDRARELGIEIGDLTASVIASYEDWMGDLNVLAPTLRPRATQTIPVIIEMVGELVEGRFAYVSSGHVFFDHTKSGPFVLTKQNLEDMQSSGRVQHSTDKRSPHDFVLWKPSAPDQPGWDSPWGRGRPGWHIECSAMIAEHLGNTIDIHAGGNDLVFPHHEAEIAQSTCAHGKPLAHYWVHNGMVTVNGQKMSKSLGNVVGVDDALARAPGEALRYLLLAGAYRQPIDFTWDKLAEAKAALDRFYRALLLVSHRETMPRTTVTSNVLNALHDDLDFPTALAHLHRLATRVFTSPTPNAFGEALVGGANLLGLLQKTPEEWFGQDGDPTVEEAIARRDAARGRRNFEEADRIRAELTEQGVVLEDTPGGTTWRRT
jgi:cysteinyl-tRNA synthetase